MEQRDYFLREIEKIGTMLKIIFKKFTGRDRTINTVYSEKLVEETEQEIFDNTKFEIKIFLDLNDTEKEKYLTGFDKIAASNIELLADLMLEMGKDLNNEKSQKYYDAAVQIYTYCDKLEKSISFERERKKRDIDLI